MNSITVFGRLGRDPELKKTNSGTSVCNFSMATTEKYKDKEETQWHNIVAWGKQAEIICQYFQKGSRILITGKMTYRQWGEEDNKKTTAEIVVREFGFVDKKSESPAPAQQQNSDGFGQPPVDDELPW